MTQCRASGLARWGFIMNKTNVLLLVRIAFSLLCAGVFYFAWLTAFLLASRLDSPAVEAMLYLLAPVTTATGFATGIVVLEHLAKASRTRFSRLLAWPLLGCTIGAGVVYRFGPMLIVFGMFGAGTASVALGEALRFARKNPALVTENDLKARATQGDRTKFERAMSKVADVEPEEYDRL